MPRDWIEEDKHKAKDAFNREPQIKNDQQQEMPKAPQPQLTPKGPMRSIVEREVREQEAVKRAEIEKRKKEIQQKFEQDRSKDREIGR